MAADYNANLIADLYSATNGEHATRICDEMVEIGDAIFPRQIYEAYKRFKNTSISHYFAYDLTTFKTPDAVEMVKEIAKTTEKDSDMAMIVEHLIEIEFFEPGVAAKIRKLFQNDIAAGEILDYEVDKYFSYLEKAGQDTDQLESLLQQCFESDLQENSARKTSLKKLLKIKPTEYINFYFDKYQTIKGKRAEVIFVEEISTWKGGIIPQLHKKILEEGSERAKEILQKERLRKLEEKKTKEVKEQQDVREQYETSDVISDIAELRSRINKVASADPRFNFPFFSHSEELYKQGKSAKDKPTMVGYAMVLRAMLGGFNEGVTGFIISEERAKELIPEITEFKGSINQFHLILLQKGLKVDSEIFGLRRINRIVSKLAHPDEENSPELLEILKEENLLSYYKEDKWSIFHREILLRYKTVLERILDALNTK